jgi:hypothetical protein
MTLASRSGGRRCGWRTVNNLVQHDKRASVALRNHAQVKEEV